MRQISHKLVPCLLAAVLVLAFSGCGPKSPEERVAATRAQYTVRLENFTVEEPPSMEEEMPMEEGTMAGEAAEGEAVAMAAEAAVAEEAAMEGEEMPEETEEMMPEETGPQTADVVLHLLVAFNGDEPLPGITVEVTQADPFGKEKDPTLHWIDTSGMQKADVSQVDLRLEGVEFETGDAFSVLLRQGVPPEAVRGQYREYAEAGP